MTHASRLQQRSGHVGTEHLRTRRPYLETLGVALALQAALVAGAWWTAPALIFLAWSSKSGEPEAVFVAVGLGLIGTAWTTIGVSLIPLSPGSFFLPGAAWILLALLMAASSSVARRRGPKGL
jgi:hypothetical protein